MRFAFDSQIASQPAAVAAGLARHDARALDPARPVELAGVGSSLHACRVAAAWMNEATGGRSRAAALDAHELALRLPLRGDDQVVLVSHRGASGWGAGVLAKARAAGARTVAVVGEGAAPPPADLVLRTCPEESSGTHSVSYLTALARLAQLAGLHAELLKSVPSLLQRALAEPAPVAAARTLAGCSPLLLAGFGLDALAAEEAALKLKEGAYLWAEAATVEQALHGPLAAAQARMGALTFTPAEDDKGRTRALRASLQALGVAQVRCGPGEELPFPACDARLRPFVAAVACQRLAAELARLIGADPDRTHREREPWDTALRLAEVPPWA